MRTGAPKRRPWVPLVALVLFGVVVIYFLASGHWRTIARFVLQFHQRVHWAAVFLLFLPFLVHRFVRAWGIRDEPLPAQRASLGRGPLSTLCNQLSQSGRSPYLQGLLSSELAHLAAGKVALREHVDPAVVRRWCREGTWTQDDALVRLMRHDIPDGLRGEAFARWLESNVEHIESLDQRSLP